MIELVYILAGLGAIVLIFGAAALDALTLARWTRGDPSRSAFGLPPDIAGGRYYAVGLAALAGLWLAAAALR